MNQISLHNVSKGSLYVIIASLSYSSYGVWMKLMGNDFGGYTQTVLRCSLVLLFLIPLAIFRNHFVAINVKRDKWLFLSLLITSLFISPALYYAVNKIGVSMSMVISYGTTVLGTLIFGWLLGKERFTNVKKFATGVGILGLWLLFTPNFNVTSYIALFAACISGLAAGLNMATSKYLDYPAVQTAIFGWLAGVIVNIPLIFIFNEKSLPLDSAIPWMYLLLFTCSSIIGSWLLIHGLKLIDTGLAGILGLLELVFGAILGIIIFKETLTPLASIGIICIFVSTAIPLMKKTK